MVADAVVRGAEHAQPKRCHMVDETGLIISLVLVRMRCQGGWTGRRVGVVMGSHRPPPPPQRHTAHTATPPHLIGGLGGERTDAPLWRVRAHFGQGRRVGTPQLKQKFESPSPRCPQDKQHRAAATGPAPAAPPPADSAPTTAPPLRHSTNSAGGTAPPAAAPPPAAAAGPAGRKWAGSDARMAVCTA